MALFGGGALVIWNDVAPGSESELDHWQIKEHLPERLRVPGFLRGRRYTAVSGHPRYFTLYETASVETLGSPPYLARLDAPTSWSRQVFPLWPNTTRTACRVTASLGQGAVSQIATAEKRDRGGSDAVVRWVVLVEGVDAEPLEVACRECIGTEILRHPGGAAGWQGVHRLVYALTAADEAP